MTDRLTELKAQFYDAMVQEQIWQQRKISINQEIIAESQRVKLEGKEGNSNGEWRETQTSPS